MVLPFFRAAIFEGIPGLPNVWTIAKVALAIGFIVLIKLYSRGVRNTSERKLHGKVVLLTGGTSGIGAALALDLATRGAQIVLLVHQSPSDIFLVEYIDDLRERSGNELVYAEQADLSSLHSIRQFATKWINNLPVRRLDMIVLCAATLTPPGKERILTEEGLEETWAVNYLANFHLLSILSPAIRAQPPDRDVRIIFASCPSYISSPPVGDGKIALEKKDWSPSKAYASSKLALLTFGHAFQKHLDSYKRPDGLPANARVVFVDPGYARTPGFRRWFSRGTIWGLGVYVLLWQNFWIFLKSSDDGAQSFLYAAMEATLGRGSGGRLIKECREVDFARVDVKDEKLAEKLWKGSEELIERIEREEAVRRAFEKGEKKMKTEEKPKPRADPDKKSRRQRKKA